MTPLGLAKIVEYNLKENWNVGYVVRCMGLGL